MNTETLLNQRHLSVADIGSLQDVLNEKADKKNPDWRSARTANDFILAAGLELAELIESAPWKWWKKAGETDWWNLKIEAIDMLHFMVSALLINGLDEEQGRLALGYPKEQNNLPGIFLNPHQPDFINREYSVELMKKVFAFDADASVIDEVMKSVGLQQDEISAIYVAKYTLNEIRWAGGYDDGTYQKMKANGVEDNVFLKTVVDKFLADESLLLTDVSRLVRETMSELS